jgi:hypothetical protein
MSEVSDRYPFGHPDEYDHNQDGTNHLPTWGQFGLLLGWLLINGIVAGIRFITRRTTNFLLFMAGYPRRTY